MNSRTTPQFRELFQRLPAHVQQQAREAYRIFRNNAIAGQEHHLLHAGLSDQHTVKGIVMMSGKFPHRQRVRVRDQQWANAVGGLPPGNISCRRLVEFQSPHRRLDYDLPGTGRG